MLCKEGTEELPECLNQSIIPAGPSGALWGRPRLAAAQEYVSPRAVCIRVRVVHEDWDPKWMKVHTIARYVQTKEGPLVEDEKMSALSLSACHTVFKLDMNLQISLPIYRPRWRARAFVLNQDLRDHT